MLPHKKISAATTNATSLLSKPGVIGALHVINTTATKAYLKLYDKATAPTVGSDTPVMTLAIPASTDGAGFTWTAPISFGAGIAYAITGAAADNDTTAVGAGDIILNAVYE